MEAALPTVLVEGHLGSFTASLAQQLQGGSEHQPFSGLGRAMVWKVSIFCLGLFGSGHIYRCFKQLFRVIPVCDLF